MFLRKKNANFVMLYTHTTGDAQVLIVKARQIWWKFAGMELCTIWQIFILNYKILKKKILRSAFKTMIKF